ncbi:hypothetical protein [Ktedonobacter sp. SOSP1-52]|nr:hypothetical protein [Ktedonobacter sp. SOSP1-52]
MQPQNQRRAIPCGTSTFQVQIWRSAQMVPNQGDMLAGEQEE